MKKEYIKPSLKDHKLHVANILAGSDMDASQDDSTTESLSKGNGGVMLDWGGLDDDLDQ